MPLKEFHKTGEQSGWAVWRIDETEAQLTSGITGTPPPEITHEKKKLEWLAGRQLLISLSNHLGLRFFGIIKDNIGKPFLEKYPHHISLSHSYPFVAAQIDMYQSVGIDLEQPKEKLLKIASRILSPIELADAGADRIKHCVYWCAKETMYKIHGLGGLHFSNQLNIAPFLLQEEGNLNGVISSDGQKRDVRLGYQLCPDYVLVFTLTV